LLIRQRKDSWRSHKKQAYNNQSKKIDYKSGYHHPDFFYIDVCKLNTAFFQLIYPSLIWKFQTGEKIIYLTFDDGPVPGITDWVLRTLDKYNAKATFFCVGDNIRLHPEIYSQVRKAGHSTGNHTMNHLNGWKTREDTYLENVEDCQAFMEADLFRPPYGRIMPGQIYRLKKKYRIIMWDVLSRDYDQSLDGRDCSEIVKSNATQGSIVVFHDSIKAEERLRIALPETLDYFSKKGFRFDAIR
jgi:peptidoglycan/xylan/chitin deacetylase (PgdA/CDA1 family)